MPWPTSTPIVPIQQIGFEIAGFIAVVAVVAVIAIVGTAIFVDWFSGSD